MKLFVCALWLNAERFYCRLTIPLRCELRKKCVVRRMPMNERSVCGNSLSHGTSRLLNANICYMIVFVTRATFSPVSWLQRENGDRGMEGCIKELLCLLHPDPCWIGSPVGDLVSCRDPRRSLTFVLLYVSPSICKGYSPQNPVKVQSFLSL